jgi:indolepyruvate ferredoxin oxidoreductase
MILRDASLDDKYTLDAGPIFLNGTQALVRLLMVQRRRDRAAGLATAGFVSGYRGSPLGGLDMALWRAQSHLQDHQIHFRPGVNEELGATAVWGSQQVNLFPGATLDGVFGLWYGKGPGVDRSGDVLKHGNAAGSSRYGGVLALAGDDHACKSSSLPHQSDYAFMDAAIPVLMPATLQDVLDLGLYGWALSRYAGVWVGFKLIADTVDTSASVYTDPGRVQIKLPTDFVLPEGGLNIRWPDSPHEQERRLWQWKIPAVAAFMRAQQLDRVIWAGGTKPRFGFVASGKAYLDLIQALADLGIDAKVAETFGISLYKVAMVWPLESEGIKRFCQGLDTVFVVEEKRPLLEEQIKEILYHLPATARPRIIGKKDETGAPLLPSIYELNSRLVAEVISKKLVTLPGLEEIVTRWGDFLNPSQETIVTGPLQRLPFYCAGCPHNTSTTQTPVGSRVLAGIGCHYMAMWITSHTQTFTQMGGEGVTWVGQAPFTLEKHVFANLGDGTYYHSGILAIRQAVAANVNITYNLLYNDAVAMTGGQPVDGPLSVDQVTYQLKAEGVQRIAVVSDDPDRYDINTVFANGTTLHHRDELMSVQEDLQQWTGVSALVYDQTCAAEKRRRRKRGLMEDPLKRIFINETVCEGCGDCGKKSNCLAIVPRTTEWGQKRTIDQFSCNKDYSCVKGFCPSFVSVIGGTLRKPTPVIPPETWFATLPEPNEVVSLDKPYSIFVAGIGGTGVVTVGALIGMAAHLEGKGCSIVDMAGLAQKGGAVIGHIRLAQKPEDISATRIAPQGADLILGCDMVASSSQEGIEKIAKGHTRLVMNSFQTATSHFTREPDYVFPMDSLQALFDKAAGTQAITWIDATTLATQLLGDSVAANIFLAGFALQKGLIPVSPAAVLEAIRLNGVSITMNCQAFQWGRLAAVDYERVAQQVAEMQPVDPDHIVAETVAEVIARREDFLEDYQDKAYAARYRQLVDQVAAKEANVGLTGLTELVAQTYFRLMSYKDEYEVARLYTDGNFLRRLQTQFEGPYRLEFHMAPPLFSRRDPRTGELIKRVYGPWMFTVFKWLASLKKLRGTAFDIFGYMQERRLERQLIRDFEDTVAFLLTKLNVSNHQWACAIAALPQKIRGFGHVKTRNYQEVKKEQEALIAQFKGEESLRG